MKHSLKITIFLLSMFFITQLIGLAVINAYSPVTKTELVNGTLQNVTEIVELPYGMQPPPEITPWEALPSIILSIFIATALILLIRKFKIALLLRIWFFGVVMLAIGITLNGFLLSFFHASYYSMITKVIAIAIALPLSFYKVFKRNMLVHNFTELLIYPGIAAVFVPMLNVWSGIVLLIIIAIYDVYAVWHAKFMQKMANFQINQLKVFTGFFLPYIAKKDRIKIEKIKSAKLNKREKTKKLKKLRIKVNLAILGGGDISFPLIFAGVLLRLSGLIPALIITFTSTAALALLFTLAKKGKFYPAMLFLTPACIIGWLIGLLF